MRPNRSLPLVLGFALALNLSCSSPTAAPGAAVDPDTASAAEVTAQADGATVDGGATNPSDVAAAIDSAASGDVSATDVATPDAGDGYTGPACSTNTACNGLPKTPWCAKPLQKCVECLLPLHCADQLDCVNNGCKPVQCQPGKNTCKNEFLSVCNADGKGYTVQVCPDEKPACKDGACHVCLPSATFCADVTGSKQGPAVLKCNADGSAATVVDACEPPEKCVVDKCVVCVPGTLECEGDATRACKEDGSGWKAGEDCAAKGLSCLGGLCFDPCSADLKTNSNVGCDYWAVDLDNAIDAGGGKVYDAQNAQFAVVVSNTADKAATVTVTLGVDKNAPGAKTTSWSVPAKGLQVINLPVPAWGVPNQSQDGSDINGRVFRIESTQPIVAYQFNPLQNVGVFSNEASLLLPTNSLGEEYWIVSHQQLNKFRGYATVVAVLPGATKVSIVPSAPTLAGINVPQMSVGNKETFTLQQGQVLTIQSNGDKADLTGTWVKADRPVAVFGGSEAAISPQIGNCINNPLGTPPKVCAVTGGTIPCTKDSDCPVSCCGDHLEEQLFPTKSWGTTYVGAKLFARGKEKDSWRVVAASNGTKTTLTPDIGIVVPTLNQGQFFEFHTDKDFVLNADKPVMLAQYMASSFSTITSANATCTSDAFCKSQYGFLALCEGGAAKTCSPIGDPSMLLDVATSQYLDEYIFLVPDKYALNYVTIIAPAGADVKLDGSSLGAAAFAAVPQSSWQVARLAIGAGTHSLTADKKVGLFVYGYDDDVSYGYPGGAGL